jgi:hypothetical protein
VAQIWKAVAVHFYQVWAVCGPLIGVFIGSLLASRWQRQQWIRENKEADYRRIFDALNRFRWQVTNFYAFYNESPAADKAAEGRKLERQEAVMEALSSTLGAMGDSLFVRDALLHSEVMRNVQDFYRSMASDKPPDHVNAARIVAGIHVRILQVAWRDVGLRGTFPTETAAKPGS